MVFEIITLIANVVLSSVAIIIAIRSSRQTSKDATRQIESIKQLAENQIDLMRMQLDAEIQKNRLLAKQAYVEWQEMKELQNSQLGADFRDHRKRKIEEERPRKQMELYDTYIQSLNEISGKLTKLEVKLNK
jgi:hypothetical protein